MARTPCPCGPESAGCERIRAVADTGRRLHLGGAAMGRRGASVVRRRRRRGAGNGVGRDENGGRRRPGRFSRILLRARKPGLVITLFLTRSHNSVGGSVTASMLVPKGALSA